MYLKSALAILLTAFAGQLAPLPAAADSRIFAVRASDPAVTIEEAFRNDSPLAVVGRGDGSTLFRIDNGNNPVACSNSFVFVTSTGQRIERSADLCTLNWDLTVDVASAPEPPPPPTASTSGADQDETRTVTVTVDEWGVVISEVYLGGERREVIGGEGNSVRIEVAAAGREIVCEQDLGLVLADGRRIARDVDICENDGTVVVAAADDGGLPPLPPVDAGPTVVRPAEPDSPAESPPPPPVVTPATPEPINRVWGFASGGDNASLSYGLPQSDSIGFLAACTRGSGRIRVTLPETSVPGLVPGAAVTLSFAAGAFNQTYAGTGSPLGELSAVARPQVEIAATDPLWPAIIRESELSVAAGPMPPRTLSLKGSAGPGRQLLAACAVPPPAAPAAQAPRDGGGGRRGILVEYRCRDGGVLAVTYNGRRQTAKLSEPGAPPIILNWRPSPGGEFYTAGRAQLLIANGGTVQWSRSGGQMRVCRAG